MKTIKHKCAFAFVAVWILQGAAIIGAFGAVQSIVAQPDIQNQINRIVGIMQEHSEGRVSETDVLQSIEDFKRTQTNTLQLIPQLILACATTQGDEQRYLAAVVIYYKILDDLNPLEVVNIVVPYMEDTNSRVRKEIQKYVLEDLQIRDKSAKYAIFIPYLRQQGQSASIPLVKYMLSRDPDEAIKTMQQAFLGKGSLDEADITTQSLKAVVASGHWWKELYAIEKMRRDPLLRDPDLIEQLKKSEHAVVRETVQEIEKAK